MQTPHKRGSRWYYYPYNGRKRGGPRPLPVPPGCDLADATAAMVARGDHLPADALAVGPWIDRYETYRRARNCNSRRRYSAGRVRAILAGTGTLREITEAEVIERVAALRPACTSRTANKYLNEVRWFLRWLVRNGTLERNPLELVDPLRDTGETRFARRAFSEEELQRLFASPAPAVAFRGLTPLMRVALYRFAVGTGLRAGVIGRLTRADFAVDWSAVTLPGTEQKNGRPIALPIARDLAESLRATFQGLDPTARLWSGGWADNAAEMLRLDLAAAGVQADGGEGRLDFHSFRHTFTTRIARVARTQKEGMVLTGHRSASVYNGYTHPTPQELAETVERVDRPAQTGPLDWSALSSEFRKIVQAGDTVVIGNIASERDGGILFFGEPVVFGTVHEVGPEDADGTTHKQIDANPSARSSIGSERRTSNPVDTPQIAAKIYRFTHPLVIKDPALAAILRAWDRLPAFARRKISSIVATEKLK